MIKVEIRKSCDGSWISLSNEKRHYYLYHDGTIHSSCIGSNRYVNDGWYRTKQEAQETLDKWLPQEKWITIGQVIQDANLSDEAAFKCSLNHWKQNVLNFGDLGASNYADFCALCKRHQYKNNCPLKVNCNGKCIQEWRFSLNSLENAIEMFNKLQTTYNKLYGGNMNKERLEQVRKDIKLLQEEEKKIQEELKKVELKHGDLLKVGTDTPLVIMKIDGKLRAFFSRGYESSVSPENLVKSCGYKKIGNVYDRKN